MSTLDIPFDRYPRFDELTAHVTAGGRGLKLDPASPLARAEWLAIGDAQGRAQAARITAALPHAEDPAAPVRMVKQFCAARHAQQAVQHDWLRVGPAPLAHGQ